jgi:hypothetical protein
VLLFELVSGGTLRVETPRQLKGMMSPSVAEELVASSRRREWLEQILWMLSEIE